MIDIRQAQNADIQMLENMAQQQGVHKEDGYFARCLSAQAARERAVYIATLDGADVAYGMLNFAPRYALYRKLDIPEIQDLNVAPAARRRGVATALIRRCEDRAREAGRAQIGISVALHSSYGAAQRLYIRLGYVPDGFGVTYDRAPVRFAEVRPVDDDLCLMLVRDL